MTYYSHVIRFDDGFGTEVTRTHSYNVTEVVPGDQYVATVIPDHAALIAAYDAITDAVINESYIKAKYTQETDPGAGNNYVIAQLVLDLDDPDVDKTGTRTVPSPNIGIFLGATGNQANVVDINDANLQTFMTQLAKYEISDGQVIDTASGAGGLLRGKRIVNAIKLPVE